MAKRKSRDLRRKAPTREVYKAVLIICEGEKTEKLYFENLVAYEKLSSVNIQIFSGKGSDPKSVVETAIQKIEEQSQYLAFDEVYCVIDRDSHKTFEKAKALAKKHKIQLIVSYPSFEYWYLCHFLYSRAPIIQSGSKSAADNCEDLLNGQWQRKFNEKYSKARRGIYMLLLPYLEDAKQNAERAFAEAHKDQEWNPSTRVHVLVEMLREIKK